MALAVSTTVGSLFKQVFRIRMRATNPPRNALLSFPRTILIPSFRAASKLAFFCRFRVRARPAPQVGRGIEKSRGLERRGEELESFFEAPSAESALMAQDPAMQNVLDLAQKTAASHASIILLGESGTGKSVLAREIHRRSLRADRPFVTVSCPSLSRELLESELFGHAKRAFTGAVFDTQGKVALALNLDARSPEAHNLRGILHEIGGDYDAAKKVIRPSHPPRLQPRGGAAEHAALV
jgi:hypothetical protein